MDDHRAGHQVDAGAADLQAADIYAAVGGLVSHQQRPNMLLLTPHPALNPVSLDFLPDPLSKSEFLSFPLVTC
jgi:hypothetical protein